jgi:molybdate transport system substrate-binding protein
MPRRLMPLLVLLVGLAACRPADPPTPLRVFSSNGVRVLLEEAQPVLERAAGRPIAFEFSTAAALRRRIAGGDVPDVAVLTSALIDTLVAQGPLAAASRRDIARVGVGVGVRTGAPSAAIDTPDALKALLLSAQSVAFTAEGQSRAAIDAAFERLGIADAMRGKTLLKGPGEAPGMVARGEADVVLTLVSEMMDVSGLTLLGPFPPALQTYVTFTAARGAAATDPGVDRLLAALADANASATLSKHGLEPPAPR